MELSKMDEQDIKVEIRVIHLPRKVGCLLVFRGYHILPHQGQRIPNLLNSSLLMMETFTLKKKKKKEGYGPSKFFFHLQWRESQRA